MNRGNRGVSGVSVCCICKERQPCFALRTCGHVPFCEICLPMYNENSIIEGYEDENEQNPNSRKCPYCRKKYDYEIHCIKIRYH